MDFKIDESKLLYGLGAFLGIVAIIYFGHELILDLSPTIKSFILLSGTVMFLGAAEYVRQDILKSSFYIFSAFSYLSFLVYMFARFSFNSEQIFLILAASSAVFIGLGYLRSEKEYEVSRDQARKVLGAVMILVALAVVFDVLGAQPEYNLELHETVEVVEGEEFEIGMLEIQNDFLLSRNVDTPTFRGCIFIEESHDGRNIYVNPDAGGLVGGSTTERIPLVEDAHYERHEDQNMSISGNYTVVNEECPSEPEERTIYIHAGDDLGILSSVSRDTID
jgi:hypothetical protein